MNGLMLQDSVLSGNMTFTDDGGDYGGGYGGGDYGGGMDEGGGGGDALTPLQGGEGAGGTSTSGWNTGDNNPVSPFGGSQMGSGNQGGSSPLPGLAGASASMYGSQLSYEAQMAQLQESIRQFNVQQAAQQGSAQQAAGGIVNLVNEYNQAYSQAVSQYTQDYNKMLGLVGDVGGQQAADIRSQYGAQSSSAMQNLARLGMGNTTIGANQNLGIQRSQSAALNTLASQMNAQELGIIQNRKTNTQLAPDDSAILAAIQQGQAASGNYGGSLTQALAALSFGSNGGGGSASGSAAGMPSTGGDGVAVNPGASTPTSF